MEADEETRLHNLHEIDDIDAKIHTAVFRVEAYTYRLMTYLTAANSLRVIDPTQVIHGLSRATYSRCSHKVSTDTPEVMTFEDELRVFRFDNIFSEWDWSYGSNNTIEATQVRSTVSLGHGSP